MSRRAMILLGLCTCGGPPAPDAEVCQDIITRLCLGPVCAETKAALSLTEDGCAATLTARTGCGQPGFGFVAPSRDRALECRAPLLEASQSRVVKAACPDVAEAFGRCPDLVSFLAGGPP